jgi:hypothetical protein
MYMEDLPWSACSHTENGAQHRPLLLKVAGSSAATELIVA